MPLKTALEQSGDLITVLETNSNTDLRSIVVKEDDSATSTGICTCPSVRSG